MFYCIELNLITLDHVYQNDIERGLSRVSEWHWTGIVTCIRMTLNGDCHVYQNDIERGLSRVSDWHWTGIVTCIRMTLKRGLSRVSEWHWTGIVTCIRMTLNGDCHVYQNDIERGLPRVLEWHWTGIATCIDYHVYRLPRVSGWHHNFSKLNVFKKYIEIHVVDTSYSSAFSQTLPYNSGF